MLIDELLLLPAKLFLGTLEKIKEMADEQMLMTLDSVKRKFIEAQAEYEEGRISESEYQETIEFLSARLETLIKNSGEKE
ncbi:MAG: hypothetical protein V1915_00075 [Candidatus Bathyarchaeota archaeon]